MGGNILFRRQSAMLKWRQGLQVRRSPQPHTDAEEGQFKLCWRSGRRKQSEKPRNREDILAEQGYDNARAEQSLIEIAVESWRFSRLFGKLVTKLDAGESGRHLNQLRYFQKKVEDTLESSGLTLVNVEGQLYDPGMAASALNLGDFGPDDVLQVDQMLEPIIMGPDGLRKQGTVMLRKAAQ